MENPKSDRLFRAAFCGCACPLSPNLIGIKVLLRFTRALSLMRDLSGISQVSRWIPVLEVGVWSEAKGKDLRAKICQEQ